MIWLAILFLVIAVVVLIMCIDVSMNRMENFLCGMSFCLLIILSVLGMCEYFFPSITPMDVYQGKTTLVYTVIDGVKVDSVVVWKNNQ